MVILEPRSVFSTGTGKTATVAAIAGLITAVTPFFSEIAKGRAGDASLAPNPRVAAAIVREQKEIDSFTGIILAVAGSFAAGGGLLAVLNRASATDMVYSPNWLPGFNKEDLREEGEVIQGSVEDVKGSHPVDFGTAISVNNSISVEDLSRFQDRAKQAISELTPERYLA